MIEAHDLSHRLGSRVVLGAVSLSIKPGDVLGIIGPNGAGKSTLLRLLAGLDRPDAGKVRLMGRPMAAWRGRERARRIGFLPQHFAPHWDFRVEELLRLGLERAGAGPGGLEALTVREGLAAFLSRRWSTLSGGERGRVLAAAILAPDPPVILADEPAAALDVAQGARLMELLSTRGRQGAAVAVVVHDLNLAARFCNRLLVLAEGQVLALGETEDVLAGPAPEAAFGLRFERLQAADGRPFLVPGG